MIMIPVYNQVRTFQTDYAFQIVRDEALLVPRIEAIQGEVDRVVDFIRPHQAETAGKLYCDKIVDLYVDKTYNDEMEE